MFIESLIADFFFDCYIFSVQNTAFLVQNVIWKSRQHDSEKIFSHTFYFHY